jgi:hypothetical protein
MPGALQQHPQLLPHPLLPPKQQSSNKTHQQHRKRTSDTGVTANKASTSSVGNRENMDGPVHAANASLDDSKVGDEVNFSILRTSLACVLES